MSHVLTQDVPAPNSAGFWKRQFALPATKSQRTFDLWFGILLPILCFVCDPGFMAGWLRSGAIFEFPLVVRVLCAIAMLALALWWVRGDAFPALDSILAGALIAGGILALTIGISMLPLTVFGLLFILGLIGFIPFLTAFVCIRGAVRALHQAKARGMRRGGWIAAGVAAGAIALTVGYQVAVDRVLERAVLEIATSSTPASKAAARRMRALQIILPPKELVRLRLAAVRANPDSWGARVKYETAYEAITGQPMDKRIMGATGGD
jgi:hypothetical protein